MCLSYLEELKYEGNVGYKVYRIHEQKLYPAYFNLDGKVIDNSDITEHVEHVIPLGEWLTSSQRLISAMSGELYKSGFHVYLEKNSARIGLRSMEFWWGEPKKYVIATVLFEDVITSGYDQGQKVVVARKIKILSAKKAVRLHQHLYAEEGE